MEPPEHLEGLAPHELETAAAVGRRLADNVARAVEVDAEVLRSVLVALAAEGHVLIEDYPGVGKTALARALARSIDGQFARIQCTADLLPADIVGTNVYNEREQRFEFRPGPIFANVVLVDEVNRASPKTQSGLLECMQERHVTVDVHTHELARPFLVLATQNPIEYEGTYPLPEAQVDRFMARVSLGYPSAGTACWRSSRWSRPPRWSPYRRPPRGCTPRRPCASTWSSSSDARVPTRGSSWARAPAPG
jgi:MoxR-like ATPase